MKEPVRWFSRFLTTWVVWQLPVPLKQVNGSKREPGPVPASAPSDTSPGTHGGLTSITHCLDFSGQKLECGTPTSASSAPGFPPSGFPTDPTACSPAPLLGPSSISKAWEPLVFNPGCTHWHQQRGSKTSWLDKSSHVDSPTNPLKHPSK